MAFRCSRQECGLVVEVLPIDELCPDCWGEMLQFDDAGPSTDSATALRRQVGLCAVICDVSLTMLERVPEMALQGARPSDIPRRVDLVAQNASRGIWDLCKSISKADDAWLALIGFGDDAGLLRMPDGKPFLVSARDIRDHFASSSELEQHITAEFQHHIDLWGKGTNISRGLEKAREIFNGLCTNDISLFGGPQHVELIEHDIVAWDDSEKTIPNFRAFIFSDGDHNRGPLLNPFADGDPSSVPWALLMTAFVGSEVHSGAAQMQEISGVCPQHGKRNFFLINNPRRYQQLSGLFRMASGASGFCPRCLGEQQQ